MRSFEREVHKLQGALSGHTHEILSIAANEIIEESKRQVPVLTGTLRSTAFAEVISIGDTAAARVGYSGEAYNQVSRQLAEEYMVRVHEDTTLSHPLGGKAKFLEDPLNDFQNNLEDNLLRIAKEVMHL